MCGKFGWTKKLMRGSLFIKCYAVLNEMKKAGKFSPPLVPPNPTRSLVSTPAGIP